LQDRPAEDTSPPGPEELDESVVFGDNYSMTTPPVPRSRTAAAAPAQTGIDEVLTTTRAVRKGLDLGRPVPLSLIKDCLRIALQAPSGSNRQSWHWLVITDAATRARIGKIYRASVRAYLAGPGAAGRLFEEDPERSRVQRRVHESVAYLGEHLGEVPMLVIPCLRLDAPLPDGSQADLWGSLLPAAWSFMLAARARGLGTAWTTLHLSAEREVADLLGLPENVHQGVLIPIAYYKGPPPKPAARTPLEDVLHLDCW